jgi:hypothetical protein
MLTCDITGNNTLFRITDYKIRLSKPNTGETRILTLPQSGYAVGFILKRIDSDSITDLIPSTDKTVGDYYFSVDGEDNEGQAILENAYPTITAKTIYKSVKITEKAFGDNDSALFSVTYQSVFPNILTSMLDQQGNPSGPTCTPELLKCMLESIILLNGKTSGEDLAYNTSESLNAALKMDLSGKYPDNFIQNEIHSVDSASGQVVIKPNYGTFYGYDVTVKSSSDEDVEFQIQGLNIDSTKICEHESGVWRYIVITEPITDKVSISYHAFGGEVSVQNFLNIRDQVLAIRDYINKGAFLTVNTVTSAPIISEMIARINTLDRYYTSLNMSGYHDMSYRFIAQKGTSSGDKWYTIAYLYRQKDKSESGIPLSVYTNDSVRLKIRIDELNAAMDLYIYGNVRSESLRIKSMEADIGDGYASPGNYNNIKQPSAGLPEFRLVWRTDNEFQYGAVLQMKINFQENQNNVTVLVENHNKAGLGGWILPKDSIGEYSAVAETNSVTLPDKTKIWTSNGLYCSSISASPVYSNGLLAWAGSISLHLADKENNPNGLNLTPLSKINTSCTNIKNVTLCIFDRCFAQYIYKTIDVLSISENKLYAQCIIDELDNNIVRIEVSKKASGLEYNLQTVLGTKSRLMHRFDLRQISFNISEV